MTLTTVFAACDVDAAHALEEVDGGFRRSLFGSGLLKRAAGGRGLGRAGAIGEQAEVADAHEAGGEHMQQEPS